MSILGTSNLHDWESDVSMLKGRANIQVNEHQIEKIENLSLTIPVESIESGNSIMNGKTYTALKFKEYPNIEYKLTKLESVNGKVIAANGLLTVAGVTQKMDFPVNYEVNTKNVNVTGTITFKMTDFNISPPTALLGTLKTGDEVTISFSINFVEANS
jgi:polyisoprenoid-binding protein YceI